MYPCSTSSCVVTGSTMRALTLWGLMMTDLSTWSKAYPGCRSSSLTNAPISVPKPSTPPPGPTSSEPMSSAMILISLISSSPATCNASSDSDLPVAVSPISSTVARARP